jgi:prefoldin subunit 5
VGGRPIPSLKGTIMFAKKTVDSAVKQLQQIVTDLQEIHQLKGQEIDDIILRIDDLEKKQEELIGEQSRAGSVAAKIEALLK